MSDEKPQPETAAPSSVPTGVPLPSAEPADTPVALSAEKVPATLGRPRWKGRVIWLSVLLVVLLIAGYVVQNWWARWNRVGRLDPAGGMYFFTRVELAVPNFRQGDERWRDDLLGPTEATLAAEGCALSSAAMVLKFYGLDTDPQRLNKFLNERAGYTPEGWIYWEKAAELAPDKVRHAYEDLGSYRLIDTNLRQGNPVIVKLKMPNGMNHFVVVAGKDGFDYLTQDPGGGAAKGLYPLREIGSLIEGVRFYERLR